ncbi:MAG: chorismate mutase [Flavobacteriales bacterium]|nr:chorismate mutase [Flavobacteriales bacterium]
MGDFFFEEEIMKLREMQRPIIISGPCSAETEDQVIETAKLLKATGKVNILRAGIWKPRTRPDSFEGVGEVGLEWLVNAGKETDLPVITEVANSSHVEKALKAGFDRLWIGARTSVNPFTVQEIADSLKGVDNIEVLIKNPINPDVNLWIGAIERFYRAGINEVHAIHRGFSSFKSDKYRNEPMWEIPLALKRVFPEVKLICDPSHICGRRDILLEVSQKAIDLIYDGLMIESHLNPDEAWSDAKQQILPSDLGELVSRLVLRNEQVDDPVFTKNLSELRQKIDEIDRDLMKLIASRMEITNEVGRFKKKNNMTILQPERWAQIKHLHQEMSKEFALSDKFVEKYLSAIHQESIRHQTKIMNG